MAGIARSIGMDQEADQVVSWLKEHLSDWFTAETNGNSMSFAILFTTKNGIFTLASKKPMVHTKDWLTITSIMGILFELQQKFVVKIVAGVRMINMVLW